MEFTDTVYFYNRLCTRDKTNRRECWGHLDQIILQTSSHCFWWTYRTDGYNCNAIPPHCRAMGNSCPSFCIRLLLGCHPRGISVHSVTFGLVCPSSQDAFEEYWYAALTTGLRSRSAPVCVYRVGLTLYIKLCIGQFSAAGQVEQFYFIFKDVLTLQWLSNVYPKKIRFKNDNKSNSHFDSSKGHYFIFYLL